MEALYDIGIGTGDLKEFWDSDLDPAVRKPFFVFNIFLVASIGVKQCFTIENIDSRIMSSERGCSYIYVKQSQIGNPLGFFCSCELYHICILVG